MSKADKTRVRLALIVALFAVAIPAIATAQPEDHPDNSPAIKRPHRFLLSFIDISTIMDGNLTHLGLGIDASTCCPLRLDNYAL